VRVTLEAFCFLVDGFTPTLKGDEKLIS